MSTKVRVSHDTIEELRIDSDVLLSAGTHPELIHIQKELLKRRDRRLELASRKREYELANVSKKRRTNEDSTWSWWKVLYILLHRE